MLSYLQVEMRECMRLLMIKDILVGIIVTNFVINIQLNL